MEPTQWHAGRGLYKGYPWLMLTIAFAKKEAESAGKK